MLLPKFSNMRKKMYKRKCGLIPINVIKNLPLKEGGNEKAANRLTSLVSMLRHDRSYFGEREIWTPFTYFTQCCFSFG